MKTKNEILRILKFAAVGIMNTVVDFAAYNIFLLFMGNVTPAKCVSYVLGAVNSFLFNKFWTFKTNKSNAKRELLSFVAVNLISLGASVLTVHYANFIFKSFLSISEMLAANLANLVAIVISLAVNYIGCAFFVFRNRDKERKKFFERG